MKLIYYVVAIMIIFLWCGILFYMYTHWYIMSIYEKIFFTFVEVILTPGLAKLSSQKK